MFAVPGIRTGTTVPWKSDLKLNLILLNPVSELLWGMVLKPGLIITVHRYLPKVGLVKAIVSSYLNEYLV
jgi:hypothetical protein